mgnify:CR=1 FL=1
MSDNDYEVGYKRPPKHTQFKPGQSGNKSGRKKGCRNIKTDLVEELSEIIVVQENGKEKRASKQRIFLKQLCNNAIKGDDKAGRLLAKFMQSYLSSAEETKDMDEQISIEDEEILKYYAQSQGDQT